MDVGSFRTPRDGDGIRKNGDEKVMGWSGSRNKNAFSTAENPFRTRKKLKAGLNLLAKSRKIGQVIRRLGFRVAFLLNTLK